MLTKKGLIESLIFNQNKVHISEMDVGLEITPAKEGYGYEIILAMHDDVFEVEMYYEGRKGIRYYSLDKIMSIDKM